MHVPPGERVSVPLLMTRRMVPTALAVAPIAPLKPLGKRSTGIRSRSGSGHMALGPTGPVRGRTIRHNCRDHASQLPRAASRSIAGLQACCK
jgi:hypothetical protein